MRCATVSSEFSSRRTAASWVDEALYTKDLEYFSRQGPWMFSAMLLSPRHECDITKVQLSLQSSLSKAAMHSPSTGPGPETASPSPSPPSTQVIICGSQDWLATWDRHWLMTRGPVGFWLSRQRPLTGCCRAEPLGFHFCRERERKKRWKFSSQMSSVECIYN